MLRLMEKGLQQTRFNAIGILLTKKTSNVNGPTLDADTCP